MPRYGYVALPAQPGRVGRPPGPSRPRHYANFLEPDVLLSAHDEPLALIFKDHAEHALSEPDFFLRVLALKKSFSETGDLLESHRLVSGIQETDTSAGSASPFSSKSSGSEPESPCESERSERSLSRRSNSFDLSGDDFNGDLEFGEDESSSCSRHSLSPCPSEESPPSKTTFTGNSRKSDFDSGVLRLNLLRDRDRRLSAMRDSKVQSVLRPSVPSGMAWGYNSATDNGHGGRLTSEEAGYFARTCF